MLPCATAVRTRRSHTPFAHAVRTRRSPTPFAHAVRPRRLRTPFAHAVCARRLRTPFYSLVNLQYRQECLLRDLDRPDLLHPLFAFFLLLEQLPLSRDITAVTLREHVLPQ